MSEAERFVECANHGRVGPAFVCRHLLGAQAGPALGFHRADIDSESSPSGWCDECEVYGAEHGWSESSAAFCGVTLVCSGCFHEIEARHAQVFRCRVCAFESTDSNFCAECLADTMEPSA